MVFKLLYYKNGRHGGNDFEYDHCEYSECKRNERTDPHESLHKVHLSTMVTTEYCNPCAYALQLNSPPHYDIACFFWRQ
jgi:hypothetical protein